MGWPFKYCGGDWNNGLGLWNLEPGMNGYLRSFVHVVLKIHFPLQSNQAITTGGIMSALQLNTDQRCLATLGTIYGVLSLLTCTTIPAVSFASFGTFVLIVRSK